MFTFITFPTDFASSTLSVMGYLVSDFSTPITLILGVSLGVLAIGWLIFMLRPRN